MTLLEKVREVLRARQYGRRTEKVYIDWIRRFLRFHNLRHPREMGAAEVEAFLTHLAVERDVAASTQRQALNALMFLYGQVLEMQLGPIQAKPSRKARRMPTVLSREEVRRLLSALTGRDRLMAELLYGSGLRLMECCRLRVKDIDLERMQITIREGKGQKDRMTMLPRRLEANLAAQIGHVRTLHEADIAAGCGATGVPAALARKYPNADRELAWQFIFPSRQRVIEEPGGRPRRHHVHEATLQKAVKRAVRQAGLTKRVSCHTLRHTFATHLLEVGYDIRTVQKLLGHTNVSTTMVYLHVMEQGTPGVQSPLDSLTGPAHGGQRRPGPG